MTQLTNDIPFLWRLSAQSEEGYCSVAMIVQCPEESEIQDVTIETSVLSMSSDETRAASEEVLEWNQEDLDLFLQLLNRNQGGTELAKEPTLRIDLSDPEIIDIVHVVAAAGFGVAYSPLGLIHEADGHHRPHYFDIGSPASLNTIEGYKACIVVDMDEEDVICVLMDDIKVAAGAESVQLDEDDLLDQLESLSRHDLVLVKRSDVLNPEYSEALRLPQGVVVH